ncbi:Aldehyde/histidinol dehydrogenase [Sesbania bispinosa]|nr:Aldehyde/histidinol dehydrogenase [Sesbania bispinosa]
MGALYMGNKPVLKVDSKVSIVMEQMLRLLHTCGLPVEDVDFINSDGKTMNKLLLEGNPRMTLFTGSSRVAEKLAGDLRGRIKLEDAGFDWKILGPDVHQEDYIAWVCDQDAYACSGQKCSAQSLLFMHEVSHIGHFENLVYDLAERRKLADLTIGPVLTVSIFLCNVQESSVISHCIQNTRISYLRYLGQTALGGRPLEDHSIPPIYGAIKPTAVYVPLEEIMKEKNYELVTKEIFGPFQEVIGKSVNGTTYAGLRARTTGAPRITGKFGPAGDPRGAGIGTPEAIRLVWSCHREIIYDIGPVPQHWEIPPST